jgi:hypothetical protein
MMATLTETTSLLGQNGATLSRSNSSKLLYLLLSFGLGAFIGGISMYFFWRLAEGQNTGKIQRDSQYTATQFLSFSINTLGGRAEYGECDGRFIDDEGSCYLGNKTDLSEDLDHRFKILKLVLNTLVEDRFDETPKIVS